MINTTAMALLNQISKTLIFLYAPTIPETVYARSHANRIKGIPVAIAKSTGRYKPEALVTVIGTSIPK